MSEINSECWWIILHKGHHAWYQRAMVAGDFKPGRTPRSDYIVDEDGREADPTAVPVCETCGETPDVSDLEPVERETGEQGFLDIFRSGQKPWSAPTNPVTCFRCNSAGKLAQTNPPLCLKCEAYLRETP